MRKTLRICELSLILSLLVWVNGETPAMPPYPDLEKQMLVGKVALPEHLANPRLAQEMGIDQPVAHPINSVYPRGAGAVGSYKALVLLVKFSDNPSVVSPSFFDSLVFANQPHCVRSYYQEVSYGTLDIVTLNLPSSTAWYTAPHTYSYYVDGQYGLYGAYPHNSQKLVEDLVDLADPVVDFSDYDNDGDGYVDALIVVHAGQGAEYTGDTSDIWSHSWGVNWFWSSSNLKDGVRIGSYTMQPEYWLHAYDMTCGVYCHELGHNFGLPDLYDLGYDSYGIGKWSLMAVGCWNGTLGNSPAHPDAYCMDRLGYVSPIVVTVNTSGVKIPDIENSPVAFKLWTSGLPLSQYFLVSNRQRVGYDAALPYSGLLIWHIDESISDEGANDRQWYPGYTSYGHYKVALKQADGLWQLEKMISAGNAGDPFPGNGGYRTFDGTTNPNSNDYAGGETHVAVYNISNSKDTMTCDFLVSPADVRNEYEANLPTRCQLKQNYPNPFNPQTEIEYYVSKSGQVSLEIFNALGQKVRTLLNREQERGAHLAEWDGTNDGGAQVANGIYFYRLKADNVSLTNKMILLK
jgi:immune inhibitor A